MFKFLKLIAVKNIQYACGWHFLKNARTNLKERHTELGPEVLDMLTDRQELYEGKHKASLVFIILAIIVSVALGAGGLWSIIVGNSYLYYVSGIIWIIISMLLGILAYLVARSNSKRGLKAYEAKLIVNFVKAGTRLLPDPSPSRSKSKAIDKQVDRQSLHLKRLK